MKILKFKTNIDSQEAVNKIAPGLDQEETVSKWQVDTNTDENILSVSGENLNPQKVENAVQEAGFNIELLRVLGVDGEDL